MNGNETKVDKSRFHHMDKNGNAKGVFDYAIFEYIKENYSLFVCVCPYLYRHGVYVADRNGTKIKLIIRGLLYQNFIKSRYINQVYSLIVEADELQMDFSAVNNFPKSYINFADCMYDAKTGKTFPHDPKYLSVNQIPFKYADVAKATQGRNIEKFFEFIFSNANDRMMFLEYAGLCFTKDTSQQRFMVLCGQGGTGKSILIKLLETAVGIENLSNVSLQELSKRFSTSLLVGKILNTCADLSIEAVEDSSMVKKLLGEDMLMGERKGENAFMFKNYSKLLFSTNALPTVTGERTNGFFRRVLILEMNRQPDIPDTELADRLIQEIPYFIKLSIQALHRMYQRGTITISENSKQAVSQLRRDSDSVEAWINDVCTLGRDFKVARLAAFESFQAYCEKEERRCLTRNGFYKAMRTKNFSEVRSNSERYFVGLITKKLTQEIDTNGDFQTVTQEQLSGLPFE